MANTGSTFGYIGRLSHEKGIHCLLEAFAQTGFPLVIAGKGPLEETVNEYCRKYTNITYAGTLTAEEINKFLPQLQALIVPSEWYEGMPMTILEAFATGVPVIAASIGAMKEMVSAYHNGLHFLPGSVKDLIDTITEWQSLTNHEKQQYRKNAYETYLARYAPEFNAKRLLNIYEQVVHERTVPGNQRKFSQQPRQTYG